MSNKKLYPTTSSNTIVWEGEDLGCIKLCKGDMVSDVVFKLAKEICTLKATLNLSDLDLKCLVEACNTCPTPVKTLSTVLTLLINKVCALEELIDTLNPGGTTGDELDVALASCFQYIDGDGDLITKLPHSQYTKLIATLVCSIKTTVTSHGNQISIIENQIIDIYNILEDLGQLPQVAMVCTSGAAPVSIDLALVNLETAFCQLRTVTGLPTALNTAIAIQPSNLATSIQLSSLNPMSALTGWKGTVSTVADALSNMWLTILDIRGAVKAIQDNCCKITCADVVVDFDVKLDNTRTIMTLFFANKTLLPVGFTDCNVLGNTITITDDAGAEYTPPPIIISEIATDIAGVEIDLSGSALDPTLGYTISMEACFTNGSLTCQKCVNKVITYKNICSYCEITAGDEVTLIYKICS